jgi:PEP-CTERM motif
MFKAISVAVLTFGAIGATQAQAISGSDLRNDYYNPSYDSDYSVSATSPWTSRVDLGLKTQDGFTGVGVQGVTDGEIDWRHGASESITVSFAQATGIGSLTLGLLFNGPEYNDVREVASIRINGDSTDYTLRATGHDNVAQWFHGSSFLGNINYVPGGGTQLGEAGAVTLFSPFGQRNVHQIRFSAAEGWGGNSCGVFGTGLCFNQSDYNVVAIAPVPEPETYVLMLAGLGAVGFMARRRRAQPQPLPA